MSGDFSSPRPPLPDGSGGEVPAVSVVLPTHNRCLSLSRAIDSVLSQSFADLELIVVDDASTDATVELINRYRDPRLRLLRRPVRGGGAAARNSGIRLARGRFVAFQDSDDEWLPDKLAQQLAVFAGAPESVGVVYTGYQRTDGTFHKVVSIRSTFGDQIEGWVHPELLKRNFIGMPMAVVRRLCFDQVGLLDESLPRLQDWEFFLRLSQKFEVRCLDQPLLRAHHVAGSISDDPWAFARAIEILVQRYGEGFRRHPTYFAHHLYWSGSSFCAAGELRKGRTYLSQAIALCPWRCQYLPAWACSFLGAAGYRAAQRWGRHLGLFSGPDWRKG